MKRDAHIHTPYCPHGSQDPLEAYVEEAIKKGFDCITFTEHAPLPEGFKDPVPQKDSSMDLDKLESYFHELNTLKKSYASDLAIYTGLEVDFIRGYEQETKDFLDRYGSNLDDSILSLHFLKADDSYICLDYSEESFQQLIHLKGSIHALYESYTNDLIASIQAELGPHKPTRIGHMTLARKFQEAFPAPKEAEALFETVLDAVENKGYTLDLNTAGLRKLKCHETYPNQSLLQKAYQRGIPFVYGSDAHVAKDVGAHYDDIHTFLK